MPADVYEVYVGLDCPSCDAERPSPCKTRTEGACFPCYERRTKALETLMTYAKTLKSKDVESSSPNLENEHPEAHVRTDGLVFKLGPR